MPPKQRAPSALQLRCVSMFVLECSIAQRHELELRARVERHGAVHQNGSFIKMLGSDWSIQIAMLCIFLTNSSTLLMHDLGLAGSSSGVHL